MRTTAQRFLAVGLTAAFMSACADAPTTVNRLLPSAPSLVAVDNTVAPEILKVCKVWVNAADADINVTVSGSTSDDGTYTVPTATGTPPNTCRAVAIEGGAAGGGAGVNITVTEDDPGAGFSTTWTVNNSDNTLDAAGAGLSATTLVGGANINGAVITFTNTFTPTTGNEGCTPGYWKQSQHFDSWAPVALNETFAGAGFTFGYTGTLLAGLNQGGGGINALARHAAAAYLNAQNATVDYAYTTAEVLAIANGTGIYAGLSIEERKDLLAAANEGVGGCPLN